MLGKKTKQNATKEKPNSDSNKNDKKNKNSKKNKKWLAYYENYPDTYLMNRRDTNLLELRLKKKPSQGILKSEKRAFYNFIEFLKKSNNPERAEEFLGIYQILKLGIIKTSTISKKDILIKEEKDEENDSFIDVQRENEKILSQKYDKEKNSIKIDNYLKQTYENKSNNNDLKNTTIIEANSYNEKNKVPENKESKIIKGKEIKNVINLNPQNTNYKRTNDKSSIDKANKNEKDVRQKNSKNNKIISEPVRMEENINKKDNNYNNQKKQNENKETIIKRENLSSTTHAKITTITEVSNNKEINPINNEQKEAFKKEEAEYLEEEFEKYNVDLKLEEELKMNSPIETLKKELCVDEEQFNENIEREKKDLPIYDRKGNIIDKKDVINYVLTNNLEMLKQLIFPLYNYATFKYNFGKLKYVNWKKLHIKCDYCRNTIFLKYYSMPEHFFKFHFEKMIENRLVTELKQKYIIEN